MRLLGSDEIKSLKEWRVILTYPTMYFKAEIKAQTIKSKPASYLLIINDCLLCKRPNADGYIKSFEKDNNRLNLAHMTNGLIDHSPRREQINALHELMTYFKLYIKNIREMETERYRSETQNMVILDEVDNPPMIGTRSRDNGPMMWELDSDPTGDVLEDQ